MVIPSEESQTKESDVQFLPSKEEVAAPEKLTQQVLSTPPRQVPFYLDFFF